MSESGKRYKANYAKIEKICKEKGIKFAELSRAVGQSNGWFTAMRSSDSKMTERQFKGINSRFQTKKSWTLLTLNDENSTGEHVSVEEVKAESAPIAETIIKKNELNINDDLTVEIHERIIKNLQKKIWADLKEMAKQYGLEVSDIIALIVKV